MKQLDKRNIQLDLKSVSEEKLCDTLRKFNGEVKSEGCINTEHPTPYNRNFNIIVDRSFTATIQMFTTCCKL